MDCLNENRARERAQRYESTRQVANPGTSL